MGYCANAGGSATIIDGKREDLEKVLEDKYGSYSPLDYDFFENKDENSIKIYDSEKYYEEDTMEFLETIAPYITKGCLNYSDEDDHIWRFVFDPATKSWNEEDAKISYGMSDYSDEQLVEELKKRGYLVSKETVSESENTKSSAPKESDGVTVYKGLNPDTPVSIRNDKLRVDWTNLGEGVSGDYNPEDPEDINLLRFDIYAKRDNSDWEEVDDASYCTNVPADTDPDELERLLRVIFDRYNDVIDDYINNGTSVKKLGEELSWIAPNENK